MNVFDPTNIKKLYTPDNNSSGEDNGQVTIIGGSELFHGAPLLALKTASRIVDMVFFSSPEKSIGEIAERFRSELFSFIWVPWEEVGEYINKSDAVLIGPGFMRFDKESKSKIHAENDLDEVGQKTRDITKKFLTEFPEKKWVIDAGSLQTMDAEWIPQNAIITPNTKEFEMLFNVKVQNSSFKTETNNSKLQDLVTKNARQYDCTIVLKGPETIVCSPDDCVLVTNGNAGLTKGGTGDVLAGLTVALYAKNDAFLSASSASYIEKAAADKLYEKVGTNYNADDLAEKIPQTIKKYSDKN